MEPLAIPTFLFYLIWFFISRKEEDVNEFVSAVCWKQNSNVIVAANSQGTIKVSHSFIHLSFHLFIHSFIYSSFHSFVPLFLLRPFVFLSFFPSFIQFSHSFLSHWTHWTIESLNHQSIMLFSHWAIGVCDIRPYIHIFILTKYLFLILPFLHILSFLFSGKMHFFCFLFRFWSWSENCLSWDTTSSYYPPLIFWYLAIWISFHQPFPAILISW